MASILDENTKASELVPYYVSHITGKVILVTRVSPGGFGESFVKQVAVSKPTTFILAGRSPPKFQGLIDKLKVDHSKIMVMPLTLDLSSLADVRKAAETILSWPNDDVPRIDVVVNNAGTMAIPYGLTEDGFETQFQANHLDHFLFTNLIMSKLLNADAPRVINISSAGHRHHNIRWTDHNFGGGKTYEKWAAYGQSKTANCLMALSLAKKLGHKGLRAFSVHPGGIITNLSSHADNFTAFLKSMQDVDAAMGTKYMWGFENVKMNDLDEGVATHVFAAFDPNISEKNGAYLNDCRIADSYKEEVYPWATRQTNAEMLWEMSEELVEQQFEY